MIFNTSALCCDEIHYTPYLSIIGINFWNCYKNFAAQEMNIFVIYLTKLHLAKLKRYYVILIICNLLPSTKLSFLVTKATLQKVVQAQLTLKVLQQFVNFLRNLLIGFSINRSKEKTSLYTNASPLQ